MNDSAKKTPREPWSYSGEVWTDEAGHAVVVMPPFVRAHRAGFEYELIRADGRSSAVVAEEIDRDHFTIETDEPHVKVAWRITALREREGSE